MTAKRSHDSPTAPLGGAPREAEPELSPPLSADERVLRAEAWRCRDYANHCDLHGNPNGAQFRAFAEAVERTLAALAAATARCARLESALEEQHHATDQLWNGYHAATARVHELEADAERLDWLEEDTKYNVPVELWTTLDGRRAYGTRHDGEIYGSTLREVIDTARAALRQEEP